MQPNFIPMYLAAFAGFFALLYVWPRVVFNKFLKTKPIFYQIFFCASAMFVLCNAVLILLGVFGILNQVIVCVLFYGTFIVSLAWQIFQFVKAKKKLTNPVNAWWKKYKVKFSKEYRNDPKNQNPYIEILLNVVIIAAITCLMIHYVTFAATSGKYGFSDMPRHDVWIQQLMAGSLYNDGVYPFGMHFIMYSICQLFGENLFFVNLYSGNLTCLLFLLALYCLLRGIFKSKISIVTVFGLLILVCTAILMYHPLERMVFDAMHRFRYTLPQEFCYFAVLIAPLCVKKLMESKEKMKSSNNISLLILLGLCIGTAVCTHYYSLGFLGILCIVMFLVNIPKTTKDKFCGLAIGTVGGFLSGAIPLGIALIKTGGKFAYAITWATQVPTGEARIWTDLADVVKKDTSAPAAKSFYDDALGLLFHHDYVIPFLVALGLGLALTIFCLIKKEKTAPAYLYACICVVIFMLMYAAPVLDLTHLLEGYRVVMMLYIHICIVCCIVIDFVLSYKADPPYPTKQLLL